MMNNYIFKKEKNLNIPGGECGDVGQSLGQGASNSYCSGGGAQESDGENDTFSYSFLIPT